jgi:uncharacterized protein (DUF2236 family)
LSLRPHVGSSRPTLRDLPRGFPAGPGPGRLGDPGLFAPGSVARRVNAHTALLLGGGRALLLQLAHPMVAAAVADHSDFLEDPFGRLWNTLDLTLTVSFGDGEQSRAAAQRVKDTHGTVIGKRDGESYSATDPEPLRWVHATLVDSAIVSYERFVGRIGPVARERYHEEMKAQAAAFGVPTDRLPRDYRDFRTDFDRTVASLEVSDDARRLAPGVLDPPAPAVARPVVAALAWVTAGLLPEPIRRGYGIAWSDADERGLRVVAPMMRTVDRLLPDRARRWPHAREADRRGARADAGRHTAP